MNRGVIAGQARQESRGLAPGLIPCLARFTLAVLSLACLATGSKLLGDAALNLNGYSPDPTLGVGLVSLFAWLPLLFASWFCAVVALYAGEQRKASYIYTGSCAFAALSTLMGLNNASVMLLPAQGFASTLVVLLLWAINILDVFNVVLVVRSTIIYKSRPPDLYEAGD